MQNDKQTAVSFDIILDETAVKPEPERMALMKSRKKAPLTAQEIEKRQKLAEQRRQVRLKLIIGDLLTGKMHPKNCAFFQAQNES